MMPGFGGRLCGAILLMQCFASAAAVAGQPADEVRSPLPSGFVRLADVAPDILEDMRYATPQNFTGSPVPGYRKGRCILARPLAEALARVQQGLRGSGYTLKVYDCYRPVRAVQSFVRWAQKSKRDHATKYYYPRIERSEIIPRGYIAEKSSHSRGTAVDITLVAVQAPATLRARASCIAAQREIPQASADRPAASVDMGTAWDCFDVLSHTHHDAISGKAKNNRARLLSAMRAEGFRNYAREWWHFSLPVAGFSRAHDFSVD